MMYIFVYLPEDFNEIISLALICDWLNKYESQILRKKKKLKYCIYLLSHIHTLVVTRLKLHFSQ